VDRKFKRTFVRWHFRSVLLEPLRAIRWLTHAHGTAAPAGAHQSKGRRGAPTVRAGHARQDGGKTITDDSA